MPKSQRKMYPAIGLAAILALTTVGILFPQVYAARAPVNDNFDSATVIADAPFTETVNTAKATTESSDPSECVNDGRTVWYRFSPEQDVLVQASTFGSDFGTVLSVFVSSTEFQCTIEQELSFEALAGEIYFFMIDSSGGGSGKNLVFSVDASSIIDIEVNIDPVGQLDSKTGMVTVGGILECSQSSAVALSGIAVQGNANRTNFARGFYDESASCIAGEPTVWSARVAASIGKFKPGDSTVFVDASGCGVLTCDEDSVSRIVAIKVIK